MRRNELEVTNNERIEEIIKDCYCMRLGFYDEGEVYIIPLNFGFERQNEKYTFYFHSAKEGRKIDIMQKNSAVGFELDTGYKLDISDNACNHTPDFQSIVGNGNIVIIEDFDEKIEALKLIMEHNTSKKDWEFAKESVKRVLVYKLEVTKISCKEKCKNN